MVGILWFKETSRWARRGIPLRVIWVSPRQLAILLFTFLIGLAFSAPLPTAALKLIPIGAFILAGLVLAFWRVKMLTPEQLILIRLRGLTVVEPLGREKNGSKEKVAGMVGEQEESAFRMEADNAESFTPLSISGRWKRTKLPRKVSLYVDGLPRPGADALATPASETESSYTIIFLPTVADIGVRELEVRVEGEDTPIYKRKVDVNVKGIRPLEMKQVS